MREARERARRRCVTWLTRSATAVLVALHGRARRRSTDRLAVARRRTCARHPDFESFNRLAFIAFYAQPAATRSTRCAASRIRHPIRIPRAWRADAPSVYSAERVRRRRLRADDRARVVAGARRARRAAVRRSAHSRERERAAALRATSRRSAFTDGVMPRAASIRSGRAGRAQHADAAQRRASAGAVRRRARGTLEDQVLEVLRSRDGDGELRRAMRPRRSERTHRIAPAFAARSACERPTAVTPLRLRQSTRRVCANARLAASRVSIAPCAATRTRSPPRSGAGSRCSWARAAAARATSRRCSAATRRRSIMSSDVEVIGTPVSPRTSGDARSGFGPRANRSSADAPSRVQDAVAAQRRAHRAVHAQRRLSHARRRPARSTIVGGGAGSRRPDRESDAERGLTAPLARRSDGRSSRFWAR